MKCRICNLSIDKYSHCKSLEYCPEHQLMTITGSRMSLEEWRKAERKRMKKWKAEQEKKKNGII